MDVDYVDTSLATVRILWMRVFDLSVEEVVEYFMLVLYHMLVWTS
jgi:hypothetical protein